MTNPLQSEDTPQRKVALYTADRMEHICPVIRVTGPCRHLGWEVVPGVSWESGRMLIFPERVIDADIVVIQRDFPRFMDSYSQVVELARKERKSIVYDLDDLLTEMPKEHPDFDHYQCARIPILGAILEADMITCPTPALQEYLAQFVTNIAVLPNFLNDDMWATALWGRENVRVRRGHSVVIGYMGTRSHIPDLEMVAPALIWVCRKYGNKVRLRFWGCPPPLELRVWKNVEWFDWGIVSYAEFVRFFSMQDCDIFIAPLVDSPFNNCKSALKFLEYSSMGIPGVYSAVGQFKEIVVHGENGFLASNLKDWQEYLSWLIEDEILREQIGEKSRETISKNWLLSQHVEEWRALYNRLLATQNKRVFTGIPITFVRKVEAWEQENLAAINRLTQALSKKERMLSERGQMLREREREIEKLNNQLNAILTSVGWQLVEILGRIRKWIAPYGSVRERLFFFILQILFKRTPRERFLEGTRLSPGNPCKIPAISIILPKGGDFPHVNPVSLQEWLASQTYKGFEVVVWEVGESTAYVLDSPEEKWHAHSPQTLVEGLRGKYVCLASPDLLQMPETYLEANLIALESEELVFTVNLRGNNPALFEYLRAGCLPGDSHLPLLRHIVRKENVQEKFAIGLLDQNRSAAVGRVLVHPTIHIDQSLPFKSATQRGNLDLQGDAITIYPPSPFVGGATSRVIHPISTVVPVLSIPADEKPAVFVIMPFLAVGGAERVALDVLYSISQDIRVVVFTTEKHDPSLGTTVDAFRQITPYIYTVADWISPDLRLSCLEYLIQRFQPLTIYVANGSQFIYDTVPIIKQRYPELRLVNQVYDHHVGWINYYKNKELVSYIDAHIGCNRKICQAYIRYGVPAEKVHLIPHGVDTNLFDPENYSPERCISIKTQMGLPTARKIITFMGRLHPQKRPMDFVEMARRFVHNTQMFFLIVGDGPLAGVIDAEVQRIGLQNIERRPFSFAPDVLAISDVVVLPSEYEGMPLVVLEAQAMGKPVVVTDVGANREIIELTHGGVVIPRIGDTYAMMRGVEEMLRNPPDPIRVREVIVSEFNVRDIALQYKRVLLGD